MAMDYGLESPRELQQRLEAERLGTPFLIFRGVGDTQQIVLLGQDHSALTVGRADANEVRLELDPEVSRVHAELRRLGDHWVIADDGLSRNGTFVNGERVVGRYRLNDGDVIRCGNTRLRFRDPGVPSYQSTRPAGDSPPPALTESQRRVLIALCRPLSGGDAFASPATNQEIAEEVFLSVGAVKGHLRALFEKLEVEDLAHNRKRLRLVERAIESGLVSPRVFDARPSRDASTSRTRS